MTDLVLKSRAALKTRSGIAAWLRATIDWLRQARVAAGRRPESIEDLSESLLHDIGVERQDVAKAVNRDLGRIGLLDTGWQKPGRK
ncbi:MULTISPECIES: hypothetical protein [unclassified Mesorhizobium]|uniref:hypothetical protein n=1 Tax=unclassified Mesorhizobium TaxID=325217 RepID=UPI000BB0CA0B|nr:MULTISPECIES: hypothetical protein [unclassified Mesorhizobium]TGT57135.1 hypothetical protein EN813_040240 [Mesorhizobium sp. M00.F.Ca.ET.170.01.1.1]AZO10683.1 hypothetical protein EJ074_17245 [Mesorhizobium sp. M3A.F.Ca.ET.080.04.2.1]PBB88776.1 hypothetical protein CK216_03460 [Mesorhizobium sp. WSM3876]RWB70542.1 MAG: hypothetical protein EOQ49_17130 [Mesorhizobium sp.]RWB92558.1 MAG: hypothetical protein EOQ52_03395 [Mesorhizobium sp.]